MESRESAGVFAPDWRHPGALDRVVVDPRTRRVTHHAVDLKKRANIPERRPR